MNRIQYATAQCYLGNVLLAKSERGYCAVLLGDDPEKLRQELSERFPKCSLKESSALLRQDLTRLVNHIAKPNVELTLSLDLQGSEFQRRVWQALLEIPKGTTISYRDLARRLGIPKAIRAVARACGANPLALLIPCHRVVASDGTLTGYRWGIERKRQILENERIL